MSLVRLEPLRHWPISYASSFSEENCWCSGLLYQCGFFVLGAHGSFYACWRHDNITPIPRGPPSSSVANYRPFSIASVFSMVFERLVSFRLGRYMECNGLLQPPSLLIVKVWVPVIHFSVSYTLQSAFESGHEAGIVQTDFSAAASDRVNHPELSESSALWVFQVFCCLYWHSFCEIDDSTLWSTVVRTNWLTLCQQCCREVFRARDCCSCTPRSFFPYWRLRLSVMQMTLIL